jgi:outer membrane protein
MRMTRSRPERLREWSLSLVTAMLALAVTSTAAAAQVPVEKISMEGAIERALAHNPQVVQARATVESAEWGARRASAAYLPSLSISSSAGLSGSGTIGGDPTLPAAAGVREGYSAGLSTSYELYSGGRRGAEVDRTRAEITSAESALAEREYAIILATQRAFFEVARATDLIAVAEARLSTVEQSYEAADRRMRVGSATRSDVLRAELELSRSRQALLEAQNQHRNATYALGRIVGYSGPVDVELTERETEPRTLSVGYEDVVTLIVDASPTVASAAASLTAAQASARSASAAYLPRVALSSGYDWSASQLSFDESRTGWSVRLGLSLPVFDNHQRAASVSDARNRTNTATMQLADARRGAEVDAERLLGALRLAEQRVVLSEEAVRVAEEDLRVQQVRYDLGTSTMLDQIASQTAVAEARQSLIAARYDYQIAFAELEALAGREL